ncbi:hypothetical protein [Pseudescherichia sp.]|uniref:hypothetical protein n=1 Tax=Pseudescherichia sp. TaxID=2055881 RepID=UPI002899056E|nr:hypothetical protein [Pseudescherichia sp.]
MNDNPFRKIVADSVSKVNKVERSIGMLNHYLTQASDALNESIEGRFRIYLDTKYVTGTLNVADVFSITTFSGDTKTKPIYLSNSFHTKLIATITFDESGDDMSLVINKLKSTYSTSEKGFISCIGSILSTTSIADWAVKLRTKRAP